MLRQGIRGCQPGETDSLCLFSAVGSDERCFNCRSCQERIALRLSVAVAVDFAFLYVISLSEQGGCENVGSGKDALTAETGDAHAFYLPVPAATPETLGSRQHPGAACHRQAAETLAACLRDLLKA